MNGYCLNQRLLREALPDQGMILFDPEQNSTFVLNGSAAFFFRLCDCDANKALAKDDLLAAFAAQVPHHEQVETPRLLADAAQIFNQFIAAKLLLEL